MTQLAEIFSILGVNFALCMAAFTLLWLLGMAIKDVTFVDAFWGIGMALVALATFLQVETHGTRQWLLLGLAGVWGLRLGAHILLRWRSHGPDRRYVRMMEKAQEKRGWSFGYASLRMVFIFQAPLLWTVCLPVQLGQIPAEPTQIGALGLAGAALAVFGILFETTGDIQLTRFKADPANAGKVLNTGLWRYTRHPNYFGDMCAWVGIYLVAAETGLGLWALPGPLLLIGLLSFYSGGATYEHRLKKSRPGYDEYVRRTSTIVPWPPKPARQDA